MTAAARETVEVGPRTGKLPAWLLRVTKGVFGAPELEIISRLAPVKLSGQTYFCSDTTHFWPDKYPLRHISIKSPPPPPRIMFTYQTSTFSMPLLYMQPRTQCWNARYSRKVRQNQYYICAYNYRFSSLSSIRLNFNTYLSREVDGICEFSV